MGSLPTARKGHMPASQLILMISIMLSCYSLCSAQCFINKHLTTKPAQEKVYRTDTLNLNDMFVSVMDYIGIVKDELPIRHGNLSVTQPGDTSCPILGVGYDLQHLTTQGKSMLSTIPVLTDINKISSNRFIVPNANTAVHLNISQFEDLLGHLAIELHLVGDAPPQLFLYLDQDDQLHLESFSLQKSNACYLGTVSQNIHHSLQNTLQLLQDVFSEVETVLHFFGSGHLYTKLGSCLQISNITLQALMAVNSEKFDFCVGSIANSTAPRLAKRSTLLSWILGQGAQLDTIEHSLKDSIIHFNENFEKISIFDGQVVESFNRLKLDISSLAQIEQTLQDQIADLQLFVRLQNIRTHYLLSRIQHEIALHRLLQESKLVENLHLLTRSLFGSNECHLRACETSISPEQYEEDKVKVHREIVQLLPTEVALVSCLTTLAGSVPVLHNQMADITLNGKFLINGKLFSRESLQNTSAVNIELYPLPSESILLELFHHYSNDSRLFVQCLKQGNFVLNGEQNLCAPLKFFPLNENFVLEANGEILRSQMLVQKSNQIKTSWMSAYTFSNIDKSPLPDIPQFTFLHPSIEQFFLTPAGELHIQNTSYLVSTVFIIITIVIGCCCYRNLAFRNFFITRFTAIKESLYIKLTSENYRLKREHADLNKKVNQNWVDIERMESLISKKAALLARLPANEPKNRAAPSAPSAPLDTPDNRATIEIHPEPSRSHSSATISSASGRRN